MDNKVSFRFGFIGKKSTNIDSLFIVEDASTLNSGDQLRLNVDFEKGTFSYVIHHTSQNEYVLLYSSSSHIENNKNNAIFSSFDVDWSILDNNIGEELFYLLSSKIRIISLEKDTEGDETCNVQGKIVSTHRDCNKISCYIP